MSLRRQIRFPARIDWWRFTRRKNRSACSSDNLSRPTAFAFSQWLNLAISRTSDFLISGEVRMAPHTSA